MAVPSEVARFEAALKNKGARELEWARWYAVMRQSVASARPPDVKYWRAMAERVDEVLAPPVPEKVYKPKKKKANRGLGGVIPEQKPEAEPKE